MKQLDRRLKRLEKERFRNVPATIVMFEGTKEEIELQERKWMEQHGPTLRGAVLSFVASRNQMRTVVTVVFSKQNRPVV